VILICNFALLKNFSKHTGIIILFCIGFFLAPLQNSACSKETPKTKHASCSKEQSENSKHADCCAAHASNTGKHHNNCNDDCKNSSCRCGTSIPSLYLAITFELKHHFADVEKQKFFFREAHYPSGYFSIWIPPKIS